MSVDKCFMFFVAFLWTLNKSDAVDCAFKGSCILPCSFQDGDEVVIHWIQLTAGNAQVHSFYHNQDQLGRQDQRFKTRTSLFKDQIPSGNASLLLTGVQIQDQGKYKCYTSTITGNKETIIEVNVDAPVHKIDIQQVENRFTCSSEGIYPEPRITWTTNPPSNITLQSETTAHQTDQQLYNIKSSLTVSVTDLDYSCTVSTGRHHRRATFFKPTSTSGSNTETTIPCTSIKTSQKSLIWRFNDSQILNGTSVSYTVSEDWRQKVKGVSESGGLILKDLSSNQEGIYTCELRNDKETYVTNTFLGIAESQGTSNNGGKIAGAVVGSLVAAVVLAALLYKICKKCISEKSKKKETSKENGKELQEIIPLKYSDEENNMASNQTQAGV